MAMQYGNGTSTATSGPNVRIDALKEKALRLARRDLIFGQLADKETMPQVVGAA